MVRFDMSDFEWSVIQPLLPNKVRGVARVDDRRVINGILWRFPYEFSNRIYGWLDFIAEDLCAVNSIKIQQINEDNGIARYCYKGANDKAAKRFGVAKIQKPQGLIIGKRSGVT